jgi:hypothetical protein
MKGLDLEDSETAPPCFNNAALGARAMRHRRQRSLRSLRTIVGAGTAEAPRAVCARSSSSQIARNWRCSNSPIVSPRQRSAARMTAAYRSLSTGRSPKACGLTLVRRRASRKSRFEQALDLSPAAACRRRSGSGRARCLLTEAGFSTARGPLLSSAKGPRPPGHLTSPSGGAIVARGQGEEESWGRRKGF